MESYKRHTIIEEDHTSEEYADFIMKLEKLSDVEIKRLASSLGVIFEPGAQPNRADYIGVLDEVYWDEFYREYKKILKNN